MQRAMARQAEAERERRARILNAEGEFQASEKLAEAASIISRKPGDAPAVDRLLALRRRAGTGEQGAEGDQDPHSG